MASAPVRIDEVAGPLAWTARRRWRAAERRPSAVVIGVSVRPSKPASTSRQSFGSSSGPIRRRRRSRSAAGVGAWAATLSARVAADDHWPAPSRAPAARVGDARRQPAVVAVARRVGAEGRRDHVAAALDALEVAAHGVGPPGGVAGEIGDAVPVAVVRVDEDHGAVRGAAAQRAGARVEDAVDPAAVGGLDELGVAAGLGRVRVVADEDVPAQQRLLGRPRVEGRDLDVERLLLAAGLEQQRLVAGERQPRGDRPAPGAGADDDIVEGVGREGVGVRGGRRGGSVCGAAREREGTAGKQAGGAAAVDGRARGAVARAA